MIELYNGRTDRSFKSYTQNNDEVYGTICGIDEIISIKEPAILDYYRFINVVDKLLQDAGNWKFGIGSNADFNCVTIGLVRVKEKIQVSHSPQLYKDKLLNRINNLILTTNHFSMPKDVNLFIKKILPVTQDNQSEFKDFPLDVIHYIGSFYFDLCFLKEQI